MSLKKIMLSAILLLMLASGLLVFWLTQYRWQDASLERGELFEPLAISLPTYELYDMGIANIDGDRFPDIFTANHSALQAILINDGQAGFINRVAESGLSQDPVFPFLENNNSKPVFSDAGLYVFRFYKKLHIKSFGLSESAQGKISMPWNLAVKSASDAEYSLSTASATFPAGASSLDFTIEPGGELILIGVQDILELPHSISLDEKLPLSQVFLGLQKLNPASHKLVLAWRDRHSLAWSDFNSDGAPDVFIGRGGVKGKLDEVTADINDELAINENGVFNNRIDGSGIKKFGCPARQSAWVDVDNNGLLDLYVSCGRSNIPGFANLLFQQQSGRQFKEAGVKAGIAFDRISVFHWFDSDNDGDADLLSIEEDTLVHYTNNAGRFDRTELKTGLRTKFVQIVVSDYDADLDLDAIAVSRSESMLISNQSGSLVAGLPSAIGLPDGGRHFAWIDYDNDGRVDAHAVPGGLYRQLPSGEFEKSGLLDDSLGLDRISQARCSWADLDMNGAVDLACAIEKFFPTELRWLKKIRNRKASVRYWEATALLNSGTPNNWLHIDLVGAPGNREAIGAAVQITTENTQQLQTVGSNEGSHYGQGNYRLYFGTGGQSTVEEIQVKWPDGQVTRLENVQTNQLLSIEQQ